MVGLWVAAISGLTLIGADYADRRLWSVPPGDAAGYHAAVVTAGATSPLQVGLWIGVDQPAQAGVLQILHPNLLIERRFTHLTKGWSVTLLIVHVRDARDILGHYPPACYPRQGQELKQQTPTDWSVRGRTIAGMEYEFSTGSLKQGENTMVDNFLIVKDRDFCRDMDEVTLAAQDGSRKVFGAAQVQLVTPRGMPAEMRREVFEELVGANLEVIEAIQHGTGEVQHAAK